MFTRILVFALVALIFGTSIPVLATVGLAVPSYVPVVAGLVVSFIVGGK